jgi:hypothetical protein
MAKSFLVLVVAFIVVAPSAEASTTVEYKNQKAGQFCKSADIGKYVVTLSFIVDKNGVISDVRAENDPGYGTKEEAIRVIKKGPDWRPAVQNGRNVNYRHIQNIVFVVAESE